MNKRRTGESLKDLFKTEINAKELKNQDAKTLKRQRGKQKETYHLFIS